MSSAINAYPRVAQNKVDDEDEEEEEDEEDEENEGRMLDEDFEVSDRVNRRKETTTAAFARAAEDEYAMDKNTFDTMFIAPEKIFEILNMFERSDQNETAAAAAWHTVNSKEKKSTNKEKLAKSKALLKALNDVELVSSDQEKQTCLARKLLSSMTRGERHAMYKRWVRRFQAASEQLVVSMQVPKKATNVGAI